MKTLADLRRWALSAPPGTTIPADAIADVLEGLEAAPEPEPVEATPLPWRVLLWTCDTSVRLSRDELLEAVGRPASRLYRHTGPKSEHRIPHRRMDGELVFLAGEVRAWLMAREEVVEAGPMETRLKAI